MMMMKGSSEMRLPIGFRFRPTDEELVVHYLKRKAMSLPLPASVIPELHAFTTFDPWSLPGDLKEKRRYYFMKRKGVELGNKFSKVISTSFGFWKVNNGKKVKHIFSSSGGSKNDVVGTRTTWTFHHHANNAQLNTTRWVMHQFKLVDLTPKGTYDESGDWMVCRVFQRKTRHNNKNKQRRKVEDKLRNDVVPSTFDFEEESNNLGLLGPPQPYSPCSTTTTTDS